MISPHDFGKVLGPAFLSVRRQECPRHRKTELV